MIIKKNLTKNHFTIPKTQTKTNQIIHLIKPTINTLQNQITLTKLNKKHIINIHFKKYNKTKKQKYTFIFQPKISTKIKNYNNHFTINSIKQI